MNETGCGGSEVSSPSASCQFPLKWRLFIGVSELLAITVQREGNRKKGSRLAVSTAIV